MQWDNPRWKSLADRIVELCRLHAGEWVVPFESPVPIKECFVSPEFNLDRQPVGGNVSALDSYQGIEFEADSFAACTSIPPTSTIWPTI